MKIYKWLQKKKKKVFNPLASRMTHSRTTFSRYWQKNSRLFFKSAKESRSENLSVLRIFSYYYLCYNQQHWFKSVPPGCTLVVTLVFDPKLQKQQMVVNLEHSVESENLQMPQFSGIEKFNLTFFSHFPDFWLVVVSGQKQKRGACRFILSPIFSRFTNICVVFAISVLSVQELIS